MTSLPHRVAIAATLHDPEGRLAPLIADHAPTLAELSTPFVLVPSPQTPARTWRPLNHAGLTVRRSAAEYQGLYRDALRASCADGTTRIFHCDFDRLLHWLSTYPEELCDALDPEGLRAHEYLHFGRTPRAFHSHPDTQVATEPILNTTLSRLLGFAATRDFYASCFAVSPNLAKKLVALPAWNRFGFYAEWPFVAWRAAANPGYREVEGLEWETPDRYRAEIDAVGFDAWLARFQTAAEWARRVRVVEDGIWALLHHIQ